MIQISQVISLDLKPIWKHISFAIYLWESTFMVGLAYHSSCPAIRWSVIWTTKNVFNYLYTFQTSRAISCMKLMFWIYLFGFQQKNPKKLKLAIQDRTPLSLLKTGLTGKIYPKGRSRVHLKSRFIFPQLKIQWW